MKIAHRFAVVLFFVAVCAAVSFGDEPGQHPAYLHALSDLRDARAHLQRPAPNGRMDAEQQRAIEEIDRAIHEIKDAAIGSGKDLNDRPPVDEHLGHRGRYRRALELLDQAHHNLSYREDDPRLRGLRERSIHHVDEAHHVVEHLVEQASD